MAAALTGDSEREFRNQSNPKIYDDIVATGVTVYRGSLAVVVTATRRTTKKVADATGTSLLCKGVWLEQKTGNTDGTVRGRLQENCQSLFNATLVTDGMVGKTVYAVNDNTVSPVTNSGSEAARRIAVGKLVARDETETTKFWVDIGVTGISDANAA